MRAKLFFSLAFSGAPLLLTANPENIQVVAGTCEVAAQKALLELKTSDKAILNWDSFSIGENEKTVFIQPAAESAVLNRVIGSGLSSILGTLESNGQVYLINPNGVLVGKDALIQTNSFIASTLEMPNEVFLAGGELWFGGESAAGISHLGTIRALGGDVILIARTIDVQGAIESDFAALGAGREVLLKPAGEERLTVRASRFEGEKGGTGIAVSGAIEAIAAELKADGNLYSYAIRHEGLIDAKGALKENGRVFLVADQGFAEVSGTIQAESGEIRVLADQVGLVDNALIDASGDCGGGKISIGGDFHGKNQQFVNSRVTSLGAATRVKADARIEGDGGNITVWSDGATGFYGQISAEGGPAGGNGGFIEVSGLKQLQYRGLSSALAPQGKIGTLLLDPTIITIVTPTQNVMITAGAPTFIEPMAAAAQISPTDLDTQLGLANVVVQSADAGVDATGDVIVGEATMYNRANDLTLRTTNLTGGNVGDVIVNFPLQNTGSGSIFFESIRNVLVNSTVQTGSGNISVTANNDVIVGNGTVGGNLISSSGAISVTTTVGNFTIQGGSGASESSRIGSDAGNLTFSIGNNVSVLGGTAADTFAQIGSNTGGMAILSNTDFRKVGGSVNLTGGTAGSNSYALIGHGAQAAGAGNFSGYISFNNLDVPGMPSVVGDFILQGGGGVGVSNCFAQVGHVGSAVAASTISGQIQIGVGASLGVNGFIRLIGGAGDDSSAMIGYGNYTSHPDDVYTGNLFGAFEVYALGSFMLPNNEFSIVLQGGTSGFSPAVIGYLNSRTAGGPTTINSGAIFIYGDQGVLVEASQASTEFSAIGYFSNGACAQANVAISDVTVSSSQNIYIGGRTDGAYGAIGAAAQGAAGSVCSAGVNINTLQQIILSNNFAIESYGAGTAADAHLGIFSATRESALPPSPLDVSLSADGLKLVTGNIASVTNICEIYSARDAILNITTEIDFNRDPLVPLEVESGPCYVLGRRDLNINASASMPGIPTDIYVYGTNNGNPTLVGTDTNGTCGPLGFACSSPSNVNIGSASAYGANNLLLGVNGMTGCAAIRACDSITCNVGMNLTVGTSGMSAPASINGNGVFTFIIGNDATLQGGSDDFASASIHNESGNISFTVGGDVFLGGGLGQLSFAQIDTYGNPSGNINFTNIGGNLTLNGGEGDQAYAQIGENDSPNVINSTIVIDQIGGNVVLTGGGGFSDAYAVIGHGRKPNAMNPTINGSVVLDSVSGNVTLTGGSGTGAIAHIGHMGNQTTPLTISGDVRLGNATPVGGFLTLQGGNFASSSASIGHGDSLSHRGDSYSGAVDVQVDGVNGMGYSARLIGGTVFPSSFTEAYIGFQTGNGPIGAFTGTIVGTFVGLTTAGSIYIEGGDDNPAFIGYYNDGAMNTTNASFGNLQVQTTGPLADIFLQAGNGISGVAAISLFVPNGTLDTRLNLIATGDLLLYGPFGGNTGSCRVLNNQIGVSAAFDVSFSAQNFQILGGVGSATGFAEVYSSRFFSLTAPGIIDINNDAALQDGSVIMQSDSGFVINPMGGAATVNICGPGTVGSQTTLISNGLGWVIGFFPMVIGASNVTIGKPLMTAPVTISANNAGSLGMNLSGNLTVVGGTGAGSASVVMQADANLAINAGGSISFASGTGVAADVEAVAANGALTIAAGANASFAGQAPVLIQITSGTADLNLSAGTGQMTFSDTIVQNLGSGNITAIAGTNMSLTNITQFFAMTGNIDLVMDNLFPAAPLFGIASFTMDNTSTVDAPGTVRIFTSVRQFNTLSAGTVINGIAYMPGTEFDNTSATEQWGFYYNTLYGGIPFTIFYKNTTPYVPPLPPAPTIPNSFYRGVYKILFIADDEALQDWRIYDDYLYKVIDLGWKIDKESFVKVPLPPRSLAWFNVIGNPDYKYLRRTPRNYHTKKLDPQ